jgi:predicted DNA-binding transcriptional regulator AlpA
MQPSRIERVTLVEDGRVEAVQDDLELIDAKEACRILGGSRPINPATLYRGIADGRFPPPVKLGGGTSRWVKAELRAAIRKRMTEREAEAHHESAV